MAMPTTYPSHLDTHISNLRLYIPPPRYKGSSGKIAVIGGSREYTGAPHFAAISALRAGADLAFIHTHPLAAPVLKTYSLDTIVYPSFQELDKLERVNAVVMGPGLGRMIGMDMTPEHLLNAVLDGMRMREVGKVLVLDADALWLFANHNSFRETVTSLREGYVYLTPNKVEYDRLLASTNCSDEQEFLSKFDGNVVLIRKGEEDRICVRGQEPVRVAVEGSGKRVGGQGDILAGILGIFGAWAAMDSGCVVSAAVGACVVTRVACRLAFAKFGRGMLASDVLGYIPTAWEMVLGERKETGGE